jgi:hypothetical protein
VSVLTDAVVVMLVDVPPLATNAVFSVSGPTCTVYGVPLVGGTSMTAQPLPSG